MVEDDQRAEAGITLGIADSSAVDGPEGVPSGAAISRPVRTSGPPCRPVGWPKRDASSPITGHSSPPRNGASGTGHPGVPRPARDLLIQPLARHLQLADILRREVAPRVDLFDERRALGHRALGQPARAPGRRFARLQLGHLRLQQGALGAQRVHRLW